MARSTRVARRSRRERPGFFESMIDGATDLVGSVAKEVAPQVVSVIDVDGVVQQIDIEAILERVDLNALLERVDLDLVLDRMDVSALIDRLNMDEILAKLDINAVLEQVDVDALVERTQIGSLIARSGAGVASKVLDVARSQGVGLDSFLHRSIDRILRRNVSARPAGPPLLIGEAKAAAS